MSDYIHHKLWKKALEENCESIVFYLDVDILLEPCLAKKIFVGIQIEEIRAQRTPTDKARQFLDKLIRIDKNYYVPFLEILQEVRQDIADQLVESLGLKSQIRDKCTDAVDWSSPASTSQYKQWEVAYNDLKEENVRLENRLRDSEQRINDLSARCNECHRNYDILQIRCTNLENALERQQMQVATVKLAVGATFEATGLSSKLSYLAILITKILAKLILKKNIAVTLRALCPGDHLVFHRTLGHPHCHAVVISVMIESSTISVIRYSKNQGLIRDTLKYSIGDPLYRILYSEPRVPPNIIVQRAEEALQNYDKPNSSIRDCEEFVYRITES